MTTIPSSHRPSARPTGIRDVLRVRVELWIAVAFMALAFGAGMAVSLVSEPRPTPVTASVDGGGVLPFAPPLTDQQLQDGLPAGHPDLADGGASGKAGSDGQGSKAKDAGGDSTSGGAGAP